MFLVTTLLLPVFVTENVKSCGVPSREPSGTSGSSSPGLTLPEFSISRSVTSIVTLPAFADAFVSPVSEKNARPILPTMATAISPATPAQISLLFFFISIVLLCITYFSVINKLL